MMKNDALLFCGFSYRQNYYKELIDTAPANWNFHELSYFEILKSSSTNNYHDAIDKYLENNKIKKINIIAHSLGGAYAINYAFYHPDKIEKLYLLNTLGVKHKYIFLRFLLFSLLNKSQNFNKHMKEDFYGIMNILKTPSMHLKLLRYLKGNDLELKASKLKVKSMIIWAEKDFLLPISDGESLHKLIKNSEFVRLKNIGHDWPLYSPELFWKNIHA